MSIIKQNDSLFSEKIKVAVHGWSPCNQPVTDHLLPEPALPRSLSVLRQPPFRLPEPTHTAIQWSAVQENETDAAGSGHAYESRNSDAGAGGIQTSPSASVQQTRAAAIPPWHPPTCHLSLWILLASSVQSTPATRHPNLDGITCYGILLLSQNKCNSRTKHANQ